MYEQGHVSSNKGRCYNKGQAVDRDLIEDAVQSYCKAVSTQLLIPGFFDQESYRVWHHVLRPETYKIVISLEVKKGCSFGTYHITDPSIRKRDNGYDVAHFDDELCKYYLMRIADSCNCGGVGWKQGGTLENDCYKWRVDP